MEGYGKFAMQAVLVILRSDENVKNVVLSYLPEYSGAEKLYASLGFVETGGIFHGEAVPVLNLRDTQEG